MKQVNITETDIIWSTAMLFSVENNKYTDKNVSCINII